MNSRSLAGLNSHEIAIIRASTMWLHLLEFVHLQHFTEEASQKTECQRQ